MFQKIKGFFVFAMIVFITFLLLASSATAQPDNSKRDFEIYSEYTSLIIEEGSEIDLDIKMINQGKSPEAILLEVIADPDAEHWDTMLRNDNWKGFEVKQVNLLTEEPHNVKPLNLHINIPDGTPKKEYIFIIKAQTIDRKLTRSLAIELEITPSTEQDKAEETQEISLSTKYPTLESPSGEEMKYEIEIRNKTEQTQIMNFGLDLPQGWNAYISPQWKDNERISALKIDQQGTEKISLAVTPPYSAEKGEYAFKFIARSGEFQKTLDLKAKVTGTYKLNMGTESGNLKIAAIAGEKKDYHFYYWNEGSAAIDNLSFMGKAPKNWEVEFEPDKITELPPVVQTQKPEKMTMSIKVPQNTLPGDYMVTVNANGDQDQKQLEFRTTVQVPTKWGWIGILIIGAILAILLGIFLKLKRR